MQARPAPDRRAAARGQHRAARPLRHRGRGARRRPGAVRGEDPRRRWARCPRRWTGSRSRCAGPAGGRAVELVHVPPRPGTARPVEDRTLRGLHPMVAERLGLWRLANFELTRLPSPIDVHLFRAVGPQRARRPAARRAVRRARPDGRARRSRAASAPCRSSSTSSTPAWTPCARPARPTGDRRAVGLEPGAALRVAGRGPAARRVRQRGQPAGAAHRGAGAGADPRAVPAGPRARRRRRGGAEGAAAAVVAAARAPG